LFFVCLFVEVELIKVIFKKINEKINFFLINLITSYPTSKVKIELKKKLILKGTKKKSNQLKTNPINPNNFNPNNLNKKTT